MLYFPWLNSLATPWADTTNKFPIALDLSKGNDERKTFLDNIKVNCGQYHNCVFVFDQGYFSYDFALELEKLNIKYVMQLTSEYSL